MSVSFHTHFTHPHLLRHRVSLSPLLRPRHILVGHRIQHQLNCNNYYSTLNRIYKECIAHSSFPEFFVHCQLHSPLFYVELPGFPVFLPPKLVRQAARWTGCLENYKTHVLRRSCWQSANGNNGTLIQLVTLVNEMLTRVPRSGTP